jgi:hypothetical protein
LQFDQCTIALVYFQSSSLRFLGLWPARLLSLSGCGDGIRAETIG